MSIGPLYDMGYLDGYKVGQRDGYEKGKSDAVIHGYIITDDMGDSSCSVCGGKYLDCTKKYCPDCGARLDRKDDENGL